MCYKLATPRIVDTLSASEMNTIFGQNNIWCNADSVEVTYDFAESTDIAKRKHLLFNEPHNEAVIGDIASFETDMIGKLKSATFSFEPIQNGSGDPSPENVRPINGRNELNIIHSGKNIFENSNGNKSRIDLKAGVPVTISYKADSSAYFIGRDENNNNLTGTVWINTGKIGEEQSKNT